MHCFFGFCNYKVVVFSLTTKECFPLKPYKKGFLTTKECFLIKPYKKGFLTTKECFLIKPYKKGLLFRKPYKKGLLFRKPYKKGLLFRKPYKKGFLTTKEGFPSSFVVCDYLLFVFRSNDCSFPLSIFESAISVKFSLFRVFDGSLEYASVV